MQSMHKKSVILLTSICSLLFSSITYAAEPGWNVIEGKYYYIKETGEMAVDEYIDGHYVGADGVFVENENYGEDTAQSVISGYLEKGTKLSMTLDDLKNKNTAAYTAGRNSIYGKALKQGELDQIAVKVHEIVTNYITTDMNDVQKLDMLYSYLTNTCSYAPDWSQNRANTAWGALIYREAQCSGYARAFKALCDAVDIPCYYVHANEASANPSHQWNIVQIGEKWYHVDTQARIFLVSDALYATTGMEWNRTEFPQCPENFFSMDNGMPFPKPYAPPADWLVSQNKNSLP